MEISCVEPWSIIILNEFISIDRYAIVFKKGYQDFEDVQSAVTTKVKGVAFTNMTDDPGIGTRVWDVADYIIPPQVCSSLFYTPVGM